MNQVYKGPFSPLAFKLLLIYAWPGHFIHSQIDHPTRSILPSFFFPPLTSKRFSIYKAWHLPRWIIWCPPFSNTHIGQKFLYHFQRLPIHDSNPCPIYTPIYYSNINYFKNKIYISLQKINLRIKNSIYTSTRIFDL